jgi:hypothetical protein
LALAPEDIPFPIHLVHGGQTPLSPKLREFLNFM